MVIIIIADESRVVWFTRDPVLNGRMLRIRLDDRVVSSEGVILATNGLLKPEQVFVNDSSEHRRRTMRSKIVEMAISIPVIWTALFAVLLTTPGGNAYGTGAPLEACSTLRPGHVPFKPQDQSLNPHRYAAEFHRGPRDSEDADDVILIRLNGDTIAGFVAQVHDDSGSAIGRFSVGKRFSKLLSCFEANDSITHDSGVVKRDVEFSWRPTIIPLGKVRLNATIAKTMITYWTDVVFEIPQALIRSYNSDAQVTEDTKPNTKDDVKHILNEL